MHQLGEGVAEKHKKIVLTVKLKLLLIGKFEVGNRQQH
jgi:hypothetical protein